MTAKTVPPRNATNNIKGVSQWTPPTALPQSNIYPPEQLTSQDGVVHMASFLPTQKYHVQETKEEEMQMTKIVNLLCSARRSQSQTASGAT